MALASFIRSRSARYAFIAGVVVSVFSGAIATRAGEPTTFSQAAASPIALLDVKYVLAHYTAFQHRQAEIAAGVALAETAIRGRKAETDGLAKRLRSLQAGTAEHTETDLQLARQSRELQAQIERVREKTKSQTTRAYLEAYQQIVYEAERLLAESTFQIVVQVKTETKSNSSAEAFRELAPLATPASSMWAQHAAAGPRPAGPTPHPSSPLASQAAGVDISREIVRRLNGIGQKSLARMQRRVEQGQSR